MKFIRKCVACITSLLMLACPFELQASAIEERNYTNAHKFEITNQAKSTSMYLGHVQFTGMNTGAWRTVPGNHVRMCIAYKPVDGISYSTDLYVDLYQYYNVYVGTLHCTDYTTSPDADGYYFFVSDYYSIANSDCRLVYTATSSGTSYDPRRVDVYAWYDYY